MKSTHLNKNITVYRALCAITLVLFFKSMAYTAYLYDPSFRWKTFTSQHFYIHYHQGLEEIVLPMRDIAEKFHTKLASNIQWEPASPTHIILVDKFDDANGMATPFPMNHIIIYVSRPALDSSLNNYRNWLEMVFIHEYTHILTLDMIRGIPSITRYFPGRVCFPNSCQPLWLIEGNAVAHESSETGMGRNNSTFTDMVLRTEIEAGTFKPISQASNFPREWPGGRVPYLYGGSFSRYLNEKYGEDSVDHVYRENADNVIPYLVNKNARDVYGRTFMSLYREWQEAMKVKYGRQIRAIIDTGLTPYRVIARSDGDSALPRFSRSSNSLYFIKKSQRSDNHLVRYDEKSGKEKSLCRVFYPDSLVVTGSDGILISDKEYYRNFSLFNEAYEYKNGYHAITSRLRGKYIDVNPSGPQSLFIMQDKNRFSLIESDASFTGKTPLIENTDIQISFARFSPDGREIVFTMKDRQGLTDLVVMDRAKKTFTRITRDRFNDIEPVWHPSGNRIVFSSDRTGVYNLHEYDRTRGTVTQLTNVVGGAFSPDISPDGSVIAFAAYDHRGHTVSVIPYPGAPVSAKQAVLFGQGDALARYTGPAFPVQNQKSEILEAGYFTAEEEKQTSPPASASYLAVKSMWPRFIVPMVYSEEIYAGKYDYALGLMTFGSDVLQRHSYYLSCYYLLEQKRLDLDFTYTLSLWYPEITLGYSDNTIFLGKDEFPWSGKHAAYVERELNRSGYLSLFFPFISISRVHGPGLSYIYEKTFFDTDNPGLSSYPHAERYLARVQAAYMFDNTRINTYSISPEKGRQFYIFGDLYQKFLASEYSFYRVAGNYMEYLPGFLDNHVTMLQLKSGAYFNKPDVIRGFSLGQYTSGETGNPEDVRDTWGLRGYPAGQVYGERLIAATAEYRFPIVQADAAYNTFPMMFRDLWMTVFAEYGTVWDGALSPGDLRPAVGAELHMNLTLGYAIDASAFIGYARGLTRDGENQVYFALGTILAGAIQNKGKRLDYFK